MSIRKSLVLVCLFAPTTLFGQTWTQGNFEIHVFQVGQADSQLIVGPTGKTLLIDVGETTWNSTQSAGTVAQRIHDVMGANHNHLDYIVATHLHSDHIGYVGRGGIWGLIETHGFTVGTLIDRDSGVWTDANGDGSFDAGEITWRNAGTTSGTGNNWLTYASGLNRQTAIVGSTDQINLGPGVTVTVVQSDAQGVTLEDGQTLVAGDHTAETDPPSENDYSITLKVSYGSLDYVTGGDTDGEYETSEHGYTYNDVESAIASRIGQVEILRVNHHGSGHSSNQAFVAALNPDVSLISCGSNSYGHPTQNVLDRLFAASTVYLTEQGDPGRNYGSAIVVDGDIVVESHDGTNYTVNGNTYVASNPAPVQPLKRQILDRIAVLEAELAALRALAQQLPD